MAEPNAPKPDQRWWMVPGTVGPGTFLIALLIGALGVRYDDRGESPGMLVWVAVSMVLPTWLVIFFAQRLNIFGSKQTEQLSPEMLQILKALQEAQAAARDKGSITAVVNALPVPSASITESTDDGHRQ